MPKAGLHLPGYQIGPVISRFDQRVVHRARRLSDGAAVAVETLDAEYPHRQQVARIRREGTIAQQLAGVDGVRKVFAIVPHGSGNLALVSQFHERTLRSYLRQQGGKGLPVQQVLDLALQLVRILGDIHAAGIVHKAVTPKNILFDGTTGAIALAGFGIASELDQERQAVLMSRTLEGPLPYISPEQTGRMNRDLDYRSDYYSLGVVLYELLTGQRPFKAETTLEWVHSHISQLPETPHHIDPQIPLPLSDIIVKLLQKSPELRYQSTDGLMFDLVRCADTLALGHSLEPFELGQRDAVRKFLLPQTLYGRERELQELLGLFESAVAGANVFCLVHGYSGVGKSALVNEIDRPLVREQGFLVQGKFDQYQHGEAYTAIATAFRSLVQQVMAEPEDSLKRWRQRIQDALSPNGALVLALVPELELIIGPQPAVAELPPAEARNRLHLVLTAFMRVLAGEGHPVVLFLDDLQWSDTPTLELLRRLVSSHELTHLLLIGAYRSNEVGPGHPLRMLLDDLQQQRNIRQLAVGPLSQEPVAQLVADTLSQPRGEARPLSDMLFAKAQGNPFFTNELLRQLYEQDAIYPDLETGRWHWDLNAAQWAEVSNDVVEFMVANLRQLDPDTQRVLQLAACIGGSFDLQTLAAIDEKPAGETAAALMPALKQHSVLPLHSDYRLVSKDTEPLEFNPSYRFQHDRVQQAAYALIDSRQLPDVHLSIARLMLRFQGNQVPDDRLMDIVAHFNEGRTLIASGQEQLFLAGLNLRAGVRARHSSDYQTALQYLKIAAQLLPDNPWQRQPELMKSLASETQQCSYLTGQSEDADYWIEVMLERADSNLERSNILATRTRQYATLGRMEDSIAAAIQGLALLGVNFTDQPTQTDIAEEQRLVEIHLGNRTIAELVDADFVDDPQTLTAMRLLMEIFAAAFLSGTGNLFPYLVLKSVNLSLRHGNCPETAFAYVAYGMLLCGELDEPSTGYQYGKVGLEINERLDDIPLRARVIYVYAMFVHHWSHHWTSLTPWFRKGIEAGYQSGDLLYLAYSAQDCVIWDPRLDLETAERLHSEHMEIVRECAYQDSQDSGSLFLQLQRNLLGRTESAFSLSDHNFDEQQCLAGMRDRQFMTGIANYHIYHAEICQLYGDYNQALSHIRAQDELIKSAMSLPQLVRFYSVSFLTLCSCYPRFSQSEQQQTRARLELDLARMARWADNCEANFRHLQYLMEAELLCLDADNDRALAKYDQAIDTARINGFLRDEAVACERAARHLLALDKKRSAEGYLRAAHRIFDRWGAHRKVTFLEQEFSVLRELVAGSQHAGSGQETADLDLTSIMKASRAISSEIVLDALLNTTINILLENAGGQWGCLVVRRDGKLVVEASRLPDEGLSTVGIPAHSLVPDQHNLNIPLPVTLISEVLYSGESVVLDNATQEGQFTQDPYVLEHKPASVFCVPIERDRFEGALYMENNLATGVFNEDRVEVIRLLTAQASVAIENARLYEQVQDYSKTLEDKVTERTARLEQLNHELQGLAERDGLTGVANRRRGDGYLEEMWVRLRREQQPLSIIMLDVDHFKAFNDNYGHQQGDDCLIIVAQAIEDTLLRPADLIARYGGEEFMIILPNTDELGVGKVAEKVRRAIESLSLTHEYSSAGPVVTISAGTATMVPDATEGSDTLVRNADVALYRAKQLGRNQVSRAPG